MFFVLVLKPLLIVVSNTSDLLFNPRLHLLFSSVQRDVNEVRHT